MDAGADVQAASLKSRKTAWHFAAIHGHAPAMEALLANGADVKARDIRRRSPLHLAAQEGKAECVMLLLQSGANPKVVDRDGKTAKDLAMSAMYPEVAELLVAWKTSAEEKRGLDSLPRAGARRSSKNKKRTGL